VKASLNLVLHLMVCTTYSLHLYYPETPPKRTTVSDCTRHVFQCIAEIYLFTMRSSSKPCSLTGAAAADGWQDAGSGDRCLLNDGPPLLQPLFLGIKPPMSRHDVQKQLCAFAVMADWHQSDR
jgi:hypothetical protein